MAARKRKVAHDDFTRDRIKTSQLINRLHDHAFGDVALEASQVRSIEILLRKSLPDLSAITHSGDRENPIVQRIEMIVVDPPDTNRKGI